MVHFMCFQAFVERIHPFIEYTQKNALSPIPQFWDSLEMGQ